MIRRIVLCTVTLAAAATLARAQEPPDVIAFSSTVNVDFMTGPIAFDAEPVAGAPYSGEAVTEVVQTLADGNRIVRQSKAQVSRDGKGRARREQGLATFGPFVNGPRNDEHRSVQISDPSTGTMVMLDLASKTAHRMPAPRLRVRGAAGAAEVGFQKFEMAVPAPAGSMTGQGGPGAMWVERREAVAAVRAEKPVVEPLGTQFMEGVTVEGTRTTVTIPAGQIGNEQAIEIVSERWMSPELKVLVMSRQSDPRFGVTTYRLTNLTRSEPAPDLFEVPADFTVMEPGAGQRDVIIERRIMEKP